MEMFCTVLFSLNRNNQIPWLFHENSLVYCLYLWNNEVTLCDFYGIKNFTALTHFMFFYKHLVKILEDLWRLSSVLCVPLFVDMAVVLQLRVLQAAIELIKTTANQDAQEQAGSAPLPSAPHRAMFQKRKGIAGE